MDNRIRRNTKVFAENSEEKQGFDIYLSFSGQKEYLMFHRNNAYLYDLLKDGVTLDEFERIADQAIGDLATSRHKYQLYDSNMSMKRRKHFSRRFENTVDRLISTIYEYLIYERAIA